MAQGSVGLMASGVALPGMQGGNTSPKGPGLAEAWGGDFIMLLCALLLGSEGLSQADLAAQKGFGIEQGPCPEAQPEDCLPPGEDFEGPALGKDLFASFPKGEKGLWTREELVSVWRKLSSFLEETSSKAPISKGPEKEELEGDQDALWGLLQGLCQRLVQQGVISPKEAQDFLQETKAVLKIHPELRPALTSLLKELGQDPALAQIKTSFVQDKGAETEESLKGPSPKGLASAQDQENTGSQTKEIKFKTPVYDPPKTKRSSAPRGSVRSLGHKEADAPRQGRFHPQEGPFDPEPPRVSPKGPEHKAVKGVFSGLAKVVQGTQDPKTPLSVSNSAHSAPQSSAASPDHLSPPTETTPQGPEAPLVRMAPAQVPAFVKEMLLRPGRDGHHEARIKLEPPHLGEVHISLSVDRGEVKLLFTVEHPQAAQALHQELHHLARALHDAGLQLGGCEIGLGGGEGQQPSYQQATPKNWWAQAGTNPVGLEPDEERQAVLTRGLIDVRI